MRTDFEVFSDIVFADDGRLRKGQVKKRQLIEATMRIVQRSGIAAVSKRAVAKEAGFPDSAVSYHFDSVDAMLVAALVAINNGYVAALRSLPANRDETLLQLARYIAASSTEYRDDVVAEYEVFVAAARRPELRSELGRWHEAVDELAARVTASSTQQRAFAAAVDGLWFRAVIAPARVTAGEALAVMRHVIAPDVTNTADG